MPDPLRTPRRALLAGGAALLARPSRAQGRFPDHAIRLVIPWPPGASADAFLRAIADQAGKRLGQNVVPENRPGASGSLGAAALKDQKPDGYLLAQVHPGSYRVALASERPTYDPLTDFTFIIQLTGSVHGVVVRTDSPWKTWQDLLADAKRNPGKITYGTLGPNSTQHMSMLEIMQRTGTEFTHIPYRGGGELYTGLLSRQIEVVADASGWVQLVSDGQFRLLVVWGAERMARFPEIPTLREVGLDMVVNSPYGIAGPKGMDPQVVKILHDAFREALDDPAVLAVMARFNMPRLYADSAGFDAAAKAQVAMERENLRRAGMLPAGR